MRTEQPADRDDYHGKRIAVLNPTKFLGNLLIAGGLLQAFVEECGRQDCKVLLVLDERYHGLWDSPPPHVTVVWYPRSAFRNRWRPVALRRWLRCLRKIRRFRADLAFPLEDDAVAHNLTRLSGASRRIGNSRQRSGLFLHEVRPVERGGGHRLPRHIWYGYRTVFDSLALDRGLPDRPGYLRLPSSCGKRENAVRRAFRDAGSDPSVPYVVLHAGATKAYKKWPESHFANLVAMLAERGYAVVLIGAGSSDAETNQRILRQTASNGVFLDLCDRLSLEELPVLFRRARAVVGNDSGPMHLAAAAGARGVVLFGPTRRALWEPLSDTVVVLENSEACDPSCHRRHCLRAYACLRGITPERVLDRLKSLSL